MLETYEEKFERLTCAVDKLKDNRYHDDSVVVEDISPVTVYEWLEREFSNYTLKKEYDFTPNNLTASKYYSRYEGDEGAYMFMINAFTSEVVIMNLTEEEYKEFIEIEESEE